MSDLATLLLGVWLMPDSWLSPSARAARHGLFRAWETEQHYPRHLGDAESRISYRLRQSFVSVAAHRTACEALARRILDQDNPPGNSYVIEGMRLALSYALGKAGDLHAADDFLAGLARQPQPERRPGWIWHRAGKGSDTEYTGEDDKGHRATVNHLTVYGWQGEVRAADGGSWRSQYYTSAATARKWAERQFPATP